MEKANLTKAELLWTRVCLLNCSYCNMATGQRNSRSLSDWKKGIDQLKLLNCKFLGVYGAEPLADFTNLPLVVGYAEEIGIDTTVITSGCVPQFRQKLMSLHNAGAKSISMSYDMNPLDKSSLLKTEKCINGLTYFKSLGNIRDVAAIATVTKENYQELPRMIELMSANGIWTFFDLIHPDLKHPGSKCKGENKYLLFSSEKDREELITVLERVLVMKKEGFLCHTTENFLSTLKSLISDYDNMYSWCCADHKEFPSWVTINHDGMVQPCDDFQRPEIGIDMLDIHKHWYAVSSMWKNVIQRDKCTCCWNTHIDSHAVKSGLVPITDYVHGKE